MFPLISDLEWESFLWHFQVVAPAERLKIGVDFFVVDSVFTSWGEIDVWMN
jgi:hypothetical protein